MNKDFEKGYDLAVSLFEDTIEQEVRIGRGSIDTIIATLYIAKLRKEELYKESVIEEAQLSFLEDDTCIGGFVIEMSEEQSKELDEMLKEMFDNE